MQELIASLKVEFDITEERAQGALGVLLGLVARHAAPADLSELCERLPGARSLLDDAQAGKSARRSSGLFGSVAGRLGGSAGLMATAAELQKQGLGFNQLRPFIGAFVSYAEERAGRDLVERIAGSIPGLDGLRAQA